MVGLRRDDHFNTKKGGTTVACVSQSVIAKCGCAKGLAGEPLASPPQASLVCKYIQIKHLVHIIYLFYCNLLGRLKSRAC